MRFARPALPGIRTALPGTRASRPHRTEGAGPKARHQAKRASRQLRPPLPCLHPCGRDVRAPRRPKAHEVRAAETPALSECMDSRLRGNDRDGQDARVRKTRRSPGIRRRSPRSATTVRSAGCRAPAQIQSRGSSARTLSPNSPKYDRLVVKNRFRFPSPFGNRIWRTHRSAAAPSSAKSCQPLSIRRVCLSRALCNRSTFKPSISMVRLTRSAITPTCLQALSSASIRPLRRTRRSDGRAGSDLGSMKSGSVSSPFAWPQLTPGNRSLSVRIDASSDVPPWQQAIMLAASKVHACPHRG